MVLLLLQAIQNPGDLQLQEKAWNAVCPLVAKLKRFYEFSLRLGKTGLHGHEKRGGDEEERRGQQGEWGMREAVVLARGGKVMTIFTHTL